MNSNFSYPPLLPVPWESHGTWVEQLMPLGISCGEGTVCIFLLLPHSETSGIHGVHAWLEGAHCSRAHCKVGCQSRVFSFILVWGSSQEDANYLDGSRTML